MKKIIFQFVLFFAFSLVFVKFVSANSNFVEDFWIRDDITWNYTENEGNIYFENGILRLSSYNSSFPSITKYFSEGVFSLNTDSTFEIRFKNGKIGPSGNGIGIGFTGLNGRPFYEFQIWADSYHHNVFFSTNNYFNNTYGNCTKFLDQDYYSNYKEVSLINDYEWHSLRIEKRGVKWVDERYYVYLDKETNSNPIFISDLYQCSPNYLWIGNPLTGVADWSEFSIDYIAAFEGTGDVVLPPPPVIKSKNKIIIIPGLGASWNTDAMVHGKTVEPDQWKMTPFVKNYDNLIKSLKNNGLVEGQDFYVWNYDWRRPISEIVDRLGQFIDNNVNSDEKVDLVGHSLGAVTARVWSQDHLTDSRLGKVIGLGGPQFGSIEAYDTWNGMKLGDKTDFYNVALNLVSTLNDRKQVKSFAPVLKDLIPIFEFVKINGNIQPIGSLNVKNDYLLAKSIGYENMISFVGSGERTKRWVEYISKHDDSKKYSYGDGDGSVLLNSASIGELIVKPSNHGDIVDKNLDSILAKLELGTTLNSVKINNDLNNKLLFFIGSPANISVTCDGRNMGTNDDQGFLLIDGKGLHSCKVVLTGTANGIYHLVTAKIGEEKSWHYYENRIKLGQTKIIHFDPRNGDEDHDRECGDRKF